ncbi:MAG: hypothetical protein ACKO69_01415, partial [Limnohabitans sp.]
MVNFKFAQVQVRQLEAQYSKPNASPTPVITPADKSFDMPTVQIIWEFIKSKTAAPADAVMPHLVVQPGLPT